MTIRLLAVIRHHSESRRYRGPSVGLRNVAAVRQIAHRAGEHVAARRPRIQVDRVQQEATLEKFMAAVTSGDVQSLMNILGPDVVLIADGGGFVRAARKPLTGAETVATFLARVAGFPELVATAAWFNGMPGARFDVGDDISAVSLVIGDDRITRIFSIRNPHKLGRLEQVAQLRRRPSCGHSSIPS